MGAGLSMASVNKIKELANSREYSLALELVEHQDLTKSLNPQFLRLCGEIYIKNDRYKDARRCLIMAHRLGPESKRVLYTFVELYLRMGYFQLAKTYYDMYMFDANAYDSRDMEYVWNKHEHADDYKTLEPLIAGYAHNLDYDWSFELYLLYKKEEKQNEAATLAELYHASFKNSDNSQIILDIEAGKVKVDTYFDIYADTEAVDDDPDMEALRAEEQELLATDDLRMHPKEAEITIMYEDSYTPAGSEKKVQKMLKKQEREEQRKEKKLLKKQKQQEKAEAAAAAEAEKTEAEVKPATEEKTETETKVPETVADETEQKTSEKTTVTEQETAEKASVTEQETAEKASVTETSEQKTAEEASETEAEEPEKEKKKGFFQRRKRKKHEEESETTDADIEETKEVTSESEDVKPSEEPKESNSDISSEIAETTGQAEDMRHGKGTIAKDVVVVDEDDGFEAEADTIEELASKEHVTQETETKEAEVTTAKKTTFEFQTVELAPEDFEEEYEVDDFSETVDDEFGEMKMPEPKPEIEETVEEEPEIEEIAEETVEEEPEVEEEIEEPEVVEPEPEIEAEPESEIEETVEESVKEEPEAELEIEETVEEEPEAEEEIEEPEVVEPEPEIEAEPEPEIEETVEEAVKEEPEAELEIEETVEEEPEAEEEIEELEEEPKEEFHVAPFTTKPEKKKLDFPVFKSSLFPDYHKEVKVVENNFNEIMEEAQDKMTENMQKEEQMQREAEALLASLGISMDAIPTTPKAEVKEEQPVQKEPSRDELKASLKIDSVKKNLLKRVKEYR